MKRINISLLFVILISIYGCESIQYNQAGSDFLPETIDKAKGIILFEATFWQGKYPMLVLAKKNQGTKSYKEVVKTDVVEFANYKGAVIPYYSSEDPYGVHAFQLFPGDYVIMRCVFGMPEYERCPPGAWQHDGKLVGLPTFRVEAGKVINTGNLHVEVYNRKLSVSIVNNQDSAIAYLTDKHPRLVEKLEYIPMELSSW